MDIAVVGPGAIGTTVAAYLYAAGHQVLVCGRTPRSQIELRPDDADPIVVPGPVRTDPADDRRPGRRGAARGQSHPERGRGALAGPAVRRAHDRRRPAERRRTGRAGAAALPVVDGHPGHRLVFGRDSAGGLGAAARRCPAGAADRARRDHVRRPVARPRRHRRLRPRLRHRGVAQAAGQRGRRPDGADRSSVRHVPPRRPRRPGAALRRRMPGRRPRRRRAAGRRRRRRHRGDVPAGARRTWPRRCWPTARPAGRWSGTSATA